MKRSTVLSTVVVFSSLGITIPLMAADIPAATRIASASSKSAAGKPVETCMSEVRAFTAEMSKRGYWLGGSDYSYSYPMGGYVYGYGMMTGGYARARPGYEIRTLVASANILAQTGKKQACESVLVLALTLYTSDAADLHNRRVSWTDQTGWHRREITAAQPVTGKDVSFRSEQLLDADVASPGDETLGSVHDLVTNPLTGKIAYVIISRGGCSGSTPLTRLSPGAISR